MVFFNEIKDQFTSLAAEEFNSQWTNISLGELDPIEQSIITSFHAAASAGNDDLILDDSNVLLVQGENGFLKDIYAASFRRSEEGAIVVKLGGTVYPAAIVESEQKIGARSRKVFVLTCGELFGEIDFSDKDSTTKVKIEGVEKELTYTRCWADMSNDAGDIWRVQISLDFTTLPEKQKVLNSIADGTFAQYLKPISGGSGGSDTGKMQELGEGVFPVAKYRSVESTDDQGKSRTSYIIELEDGRSVWSRGGADKTLKSDVGRAKLDANLAVGGVNLAVGNIKIGKDGKTYLDSAFRYTMAVNLPVNPIAPVPADAPVDLSAIPF